jgi:hypothetical protein
MCILTCIAAPRPTGRGPGRGMRRVFGLTAFAARAVGRSAWRGRLPPRAGRARCRGRATRGLAWGSGRRAGPGGARAWRGAKGGGRRDHGQRLREGSQGRMAGGRWTCRAFNGCVRSLGLLGLGKMCITEGIFNSRHRAQTHRPATRTPPCACLARPGIMLRRSCPAAPQLPSPGRGAQPPRGRAPTCKHGLRATTDAQGVKEGVQGQGAAFCGAPRPARAVPFKCASRGRPAGGLGGRAAGCGLAAVFGAAACKPGAGMVARGFHTRGWVL